MQAITPQEFAQQFSLQQCSDEAVFAPAIACLLRLCAVRWGVTSQTEMLHQLSDLLKTAQQWTPKTSQLVKETLHHLLEIGDLQLIEGDSSTINNWQRYQLGFQPLADVAEEGERAQIIMPSLSELVACGDLFFEIGCREDEVYGPIRGDIEFNNPKDLIRWYSALGSGVQAQLSLTDWIRRPHFTIVDLPQLWHTAVASLEAQKKAVVDADEYAVIAGEPGQFFGTRAMVAPSSRVVQLMDAPNEIVCGWRQEPTSSSWTPCLLDNRDAKQVYVTDVADDDALYWLLLAKGVHVGKPEVLQVQDNTVHCTCLLPKQLMKPLRYLQLAQQGWKYVFPNQRVAQEVANVVAQLGGLQLQ